MSFFILCQVIITQNCNLVYYKRDYRKELRRRNEIGQITLITFCTFLYFYIMSLSVYMCTVYCASFVADCCKYSQSKEYKGCSMLNQNDFSDKKLQLHFLSLKVFFIHQCHETCFYLPLSRGMITNMLSIQIVTNSCGTFLFRIVPQFLCLGLKYLYIFMITCYSVF